MVVALVLSPLFSVDVADDRAVVEDAPVVSLWVVGRAKQ
jgi:hypothetical protein